MATLDDKECWSRLEASSHGVLATLHRGRGVDAVPVVFALDGHRVLLPIDTVKPKGNRELQRVANLRADRRCVLLVDCYHRDWTRLWWVRVHANAAPATDRLAEFCSMLGQRFDEYSSPGAISDVLVLEPTAITGWTAASR